MEFVKFVKVGNLIYRNATIYHTDENGNQTKILPLPESEEELKKVIIDTLNYLTDVYFYRQAEARGGYRNMGEIKVDADAGDTDARFLLQLYNAIWNKEEELEENIQSKTLEELQELIKDIPGYCIPQYRQVETSLTESTSTEE